MRHTIKKLWWLLLVSPLLAYSQSNDSAVIKAALSYNFAKYTQWPDSAIADELTLCYFNSVYQVGFEKFADKKINVKTVQSRQLTTIDDVDGCQLLYIDSENQTILPQLLTYLKAKPILTVSDMPGFIDSGGMIEIVSKANKFRFKVNLLQLQQHDLTISSQVLKLAIEVKRGNITR